MLRGWTSYFRHGVSSRTFAHLHQYCWERIVHLLRRKHKRATWRWLKRRYLEVAETALPGWECQPGLAPPCSLVLAPPVRC
ncbi:MAG: hypothetical protein GY724_30240 [Actinomycetia bacterium]|nr:hypothetical protein [Actinomycetes bacterium]